MRRPGGGRHGRKRSSADPLVRVQALNREWWEQSPMNYDWRASSGHAPGSPEWFTDQDRRSSAQHDHFLGGRTPFEAVLGDPFLEGKEVLEIGTGSGLHAELLARAGAQVKGVDISEPAVELTRRRFELRGLTGSFERWDAELDREDFHDRFDLVWSWGVLHHSAHTARIVRNVSAWLREGALFGGMVYHRDSSRLAVALLRDWVLGLNWRSHTIDEALWRNTDGFSARFYPADQWRDLLLAFFEEASTDVQGLDVDAVPLPEPLRGAIWRRMSPSARRQRLERVGHFLLFKAAAPRRSVARG